VTQARAKAPAADPAVVFDVMKIGDVPAVAALERRSFQDPWPASLFRRELELPFSKVFIARVAPGDENDVVGYVCRWLTADRMEIQNVAVDPRWRRRSIGRRLLALVIEEARAAGVERALLEVRAANEAALALYRGFGFRVNGRRRRYYDDGEDALLMELRFEAADG
jgi:[ribosomal protein S18]-alanine N-acetyltransferase